MAEVQWNALFQMPNPGEQFVNAFSQGMQTRQQDADRQRQRAEQLQERQKAEAQAGLEAHRDNIKIGAQIIRSVQPKDQAGWDQVLGMAQQYGLPVNEIPRQFDPQYVQQVSHLADALDPPKAASADLPNIAKEVNYFRSIGRDDLAQQIMERHAEGPPIVQQNADGTATIIPRSMAGGQAPASTNVPKVSDQASYDAIPPGAQYQTPDGHIRVKGGQAGHSSPAGFP